MSSKEKLSKKATKRSALAALRAKRQGLSSTGGGLDDVEFDDVEDVYQKMDEVEYREYVEGKRQREDFVVDDGELVVAFNTLFCVCPGRRACKINGGAGFEWVGGVYHHFFAVEVYNIEVNHHIIIGAPGCDMLMYICPGSCFF